MSILSGLWSGTVSGSTVGSLQLELENVNGNLEGVLRISDQALAITIHYDCKGSAKNNEIKFEFEPRIFPEGADVAPGKCTAALQQNGSLTGTWQTENGGAGTFVALKSNSGVPPTSRHAAAAISYERKRRVLSCAVDTDILRRVYRDLSAAADEAARFEVARQAQSAAGSQNPQTTAADAAAIRVLYSVTLLARGANGEQILSLDPSLLEEDKLPKPIEWVKLAIGDLYHIERQALAPNRATITLDFTRPPLFDLSNPSGAPTANNSSIQVSGNESMWVSGVHDKVTTTLSQGRVRTGWLHSGYTYDVLVFLLGLPASLSAAMLAARWSSGDVPAQIGVFLFTGLASLLVFRLSFSAVRWLLPYIEFSAPPQPVHRQVRIVASVLVLSILSSLAATAIWVAVVRTP